MKCLILFHVVITFGFLLQAKSHTNARFAEKLSANRRISSPTRVSTPASNHSPAISAEELSRGRSTCVDTKKRNTPNWDRSSHSARTPEVPPKDIFRSPKHLPRRKTQKRFQNSPLCVHHSYKCPTRAASSKDPTACCTSHLPTKTWTIWYWKMVSRYLRWDQRTPISTGLKEKTSGLLEE